MTNFVTTKRALLTSVLSLVLCFAMLLGTTFAWFTDTVTSSGNVIQTGNLKVKMEWEEGNVVVADSVWKDASQGPIFNNKLWEPGRIEAKHIKITNVGTLALKYELNIVPQGTVSELADVIDVYYFETATQLDRSIATNGIRLGTLAELLNPGTSENPNDNHISKLINGKLDENGDWDDFTIALKMQETAGNEYQDKSIGSDFSVQLLATQMASENDSFDNQYDANLDPNEDGIYASLDDGSTVFYYGEESENAGKVILTALPEDLGSEYVVPDEVDVSGTTDFCGLSDSPEKWAQTILSCSKKTIKNPAECIKACGYEITTQAEKIFSIFAGENK